MKETIEWADEDGPPLEYEWPDLTYVLAPSELPGVWVGHCLEVDVVSQGEGPEQAFVETMRAAGITIAMDRRVGLDPFVRCAPEEYWPPEKLAEWKQKRRAMRRLQVVKA